MFSFSFFFSSRSHALSSRSLGIALQFPDLFISHLAGLTGKLSKLVAHRVEKLRENEGKHVDRMRELAEPERQYRDVWSNNEHEQVPAVAGSGG